MSSTSTPVRESQLSTALARDRLGVAAVVFFVMSAAAPLTVVAGVVPTGLDQHVLVTLESRERDQLFDQMRRRLPAMLQHLVGHAEAAVGDAVMARRA